MKITSGPEMDDASRAALASGRAEPSVALFLDVLMEMRGISAGEGEAIAGASLEAETPVTMTVNALEMAFAAIERGPVRPPKQAMVYSDLVAVPAVLQDAILAAEAGRGWSLYGPGIRRLPLGLAGKAKADVLRIDPGAAVPWHTHKGQELTLCLIGEYTDGIRNFGPGDFSVADGSVRHRPVAHKAGHVYALAVTDAGLKFEGFLGALQKLMGG